MEIDLNRFRDIFFQEADEHLASMESTLLLLEATPDDTDLLNTLFRGAHSIKGASGTFGFTQVVNFTHDMESLLDRMRSGDVPSCRERLELVLESVDMLRTLIDAARSGTPASDDGQPLRDLLTVAQRKGAFRRGQPVQLRATGGDRTYAVHFRPAPDILRNGLDPALVVRDLAKASEIVELRADLSRLPRLEQLDPESCYIGWDLRIKSGQTCDELRELFAFVEDGADLSIRAECESRKGAPAPPATPPAGQSRPATHEGTIRVATGKVDKLIDLVGELVIAQSMAAQILQGFTLSKIEELQRAFAEIERHTRELQERVMGVRMLPIGTVFSRMPRLVHDLSTTTGKQIALEMTGEDTELDKGVVESMSDPLMHLIRNAADHGLETREERIAAGKPEQGIIRLRAYHQGGSVMVEVADDGRGLDSEKIRAKALERGLIRADDALTTQQIQALIFEPGFSTAQAVTGISGRGVGMDVVKRNVDALNGTVSVASAPGRGASVRITLPLTLAILDGLLLRVGAEVYVLPLISIVESLRPERRHLALVAGQGEVVVVRGEPLPLVRLHELLNVPGAVTDASSGLVVIAESQGALLALLVDEVVGQQQVVVKTLETHFRKVDGVIGATILGDGRASLILDIAGIAQMAKAGGPGVRQAAEAVPQI